MSAPAWTPGPWVRDRTSGANCDVRAESGRKVALCWGLSTSKAAQMNSPAYRAECDANARLIAAAPDLYEALAALQLQALQSPDLLKTEWGMEALDKARAALAKAGAA